MLWEAATGRRFWQGLDELEIYQRLVSGDLPTKSGAAEMHPQIYAIAAQALAPNPNHRFTSAAQMRSALGAIPQLTASSSAVSGYLYQLFVDDRRRFHERVSEEIERLESGQWPVDLPRLGPERAPTSTPTAQSSDVRGSVAKPDSAAPVSVRTSPTVRTTFTAVTAQRPSAPGPLPFLVALAAAALVLAAWMVVRDTPPPSKAASSAALSLAPAPAASLPSPSGSGAIEPTAPFVASASSSAPAAPIPPADKVYRPPPAVARPAYRKVESPDGFPDIAHAARARRRLDVDDPWSK
jgi:hypothetical protein